MKAWLKLSLIGAVLLGGIVAALWQWRQATTLRRSVAHMKQAMADPRSDARLRERVANGSDSDAARHVRDEIARTRQEIATLERRLQQPAAPFRVHAHFTENRDPEKGPVRLEQFRDQGRATPSAAFQTVVWAATTGADDAFPALFAVSLTSREKLRAILASMAPETRTRYEPPEKLIGLLFAREILDEEGFEIGETTEPDASGRVQLRVFRIRDGRQSKSEKKYPLVQGPDGWRFPITDKMVDEIPALLAQASMYVPPRALKNVLNSDPRW